MMITISLLGLGSFEHAANSVIRKEVELSGNQSDEPNREKL